jgi:cytochrome P450
MMLATLLDFPLDERHKLPHWSDVSICNVRSPESPVHSEEERFAEMQKMAERMMSLFEERRQASPKFDLISMLAHSNATNDLPPHEFMGNVALLIAAGTDTTRNSMSGGLLALNEFPDEYRKLIANPALVESMIPEILRYVSPVIHFRRTPTQDAEVAGQLIPAGSKVILWYISGNRDEEVIEQPNRLIIDRKKPRQHLAFGAGIHRCVGDRLAEMQLRILWEEVLQRFPMIEVVGEPKRVYSSFVRGIRSLPVRIPT